MGEVTQLMEWRPHIKIMGISGKHYIFPLQDFMDLINGKKKLADLDGGEDILPVILNEWIGTLMDDE